MLRNLIAIPAGIVLAVGALEIAAELFWRFPVREEPLLVTTASCVAAMLGSVVAARVAVNPRLRAGSGAAVGFSAGFTPWVFSDNLVYLLVPVACGALASWLTWKLDRDRDSSKSLLLSLGV